jgi:hypothetical protein
MNAGKWLIVGILTLALAAGVASWTLRYYRTDGVQAFWGKQTLDLIANAPEVDALRFQPDQPAERRRATVAKGMLNMRYMLGSDFAYGWERLGSEDIKAPRDAWGLEFRRGKESFQIRFNSNCTYARDPGSAKDITLVPAAAESLRSFFEERFAEEAASPSNESRSAQ